MRNDYESIFEDGSGQMKVAHGDKHKYLAMKLDFSEKGQVSISMCDCVKKIMVAWDMAVSKHESNGFELVKCRMKRRLTAAPETLFRIDEDLIKLDSNLATIFHNIVVKTLFVTKRTRPNTATAIAFLTTRVREPNMDDWKKLQHLVEYLRGTSNMILTLSVDKLSILEWYVDASFAVHGNMCGHTGGGLMVGKGFPIVCSTKRKLNTSSLMESELVRVDDMMPMILWTRHFMLAQGYKVKGNINYQDNKSKLLLE